MSYNKQEDKVKANWDERFKKKYHTEQVSPLVMKFVKKYGEEIQGKILDLGCGTGINLAYLSEQGFKTYGLDISTTAISRVKERKLHINLKIGSFHNLPYENETFNAIICLRVLQHTDWNGAEKAFSELNRVLKKNGLILLSVRSTKMRIQAGKRIQDYGLTFISEAGKKKGIILHQYSRKEIEELALKNSLEIISIREKIIKRKEGPKAHWLAVLRKN